MLWMAKNARFSPRARRWKAYAGCRMGETGEAGSRDDASGEPHDVGTAERYSNLFIVIST